MQEQQLKQRHRISTLAKRQIECVFAEQFFSHPNAKLIHAKNQALPLIEKHLRTYMSTMVSLAYPWCPWEVALEHAKSFLWNSLQRRDNPVYYKHAEGKVVYIYLTPGIDIRSRMADSPRVNKDEVVELISPDPKSSWFTKVGFLYDFFYVLGLNKNPNKVILRQSVKAKVHKCLKYNSNNNDMCEQYTLKRLCVKWPPAGKTVLNCRDLLKMNNDLFQRGVVDIYISNQAENEYDDN